jgi:tetraacyldisaccharide 4'-kinase
MPEYLWRARETPAQRAALAPLLPLECAWRAGARLHRAAYERGWRERLSLPCAAVSVGNLAVGGSGKTPLVGWLARALRARGRRVAILSRGVGGARSREPNVVSDGTRALLGSADVGDEPVWLAQRTPGVPVLAGRDRWALGLRAVQLFAIDLALLDDGFQHHRLHRDLDLVCIDAAMGLGNGHVLPRGPLREPPRALGRAHALIFTRAQPPALPGPLPVRAGIPRFRVAIAPRALHDLEGRELEPAAALRGRRIGLLAAIARPARFERTLAELGARVAARRVFADHHAYAPAEIRSLSRELEWVTTEKDAVKISPGWLEGHRLSVLVEDVAPEDPDALLDFVLRGAAARAPVP